MTTANDSFSLFLQGKGALWPAVTSFLADAEKTLGADLGVLMPPEMDPGAKLHNSTIGGPGQSLVVAKNTKSPELAVKLVSFLNSKAEVLAAEKINSYPVVRNDITLAGDGLEGGLQHREDPQVLQHLQLLGGQPAHPGPANVFYTQTSLVAIGKMTPAELAAEMDKGRAVDRPPRLLK